jgi:hypothetical protein
MRAPFRTKLLPPSRKSTWTAGCYLPFAEIKNALASEEARLDNCLHVDVPIAPHKWDFGRISYQN